MSSTPGTAEYLAEIKRELAQALKDNGFTGPTVTLDLHSSFEDVKLAVDTMNRYGRWVIGVQAHLLQQRIDAHNHAVRVARGERENAKAAARVQAAACKSCFCVHPAGDCY